MISGWLIATAKCVQLGEKCPVSLLTTVHPTGAADYWLATFILEGRRKDGQYYPTNTVRNILAAIFIT